MQLSEQWKFGAIVANAYGWFLSFGTFRKSGALAQLGRAQIEPTVGLLREGKARVEGILSKGISADFCQSLNSMFSEPRVFAGVENGKPYVWLEFENISDAGFGRSNFEKYKVPIPLSEVEETIAAIGLASHRAELLMQQAQLAQATLPPQSTLRGVVGVGFLVLGGLIWVCIFVNACRESFR